MKKILFGLLTTAVIAAPAVAADLPVKYAPMPAAAPILIWDGFYIGIMGGWIGSTSANQTITGNDIVSNFALAEGIVPTSLNDKVNAGFVGGTFGYGRQFGAFVLGLEIDGAWSGAKKTDTFVFSNAEEKASSLSLAAIYHPEFNVVTTSFARLDWFGSVRGRVGYLLTPTTLLYGTAGFAFGEVEASTVVALNIPSHHFTAATVANFSDNRIGWTAGAGIEQKFWDKWSAKIEYRYMDLGSANYTGQTSLIGIIPVSFNTQQDFKYNLVLAGINYKF